MRTRNINLKIMKNIKHKIPRYNFPSERNAFIYNQIWQPIKYINYIISLMRKFVGYLTEISMYPLNNTETVCCFDKNFQ